MAKESKQKQESDKSSSGARGKPQDKKQSERRAASIC